MENMRELIEGVAQQIEDTSASANVLIGFDGFIDEIIHLVDTRESATEYTKIPTIAEFGERISAAAGLSCNVEMVPQQVKLGGNGPIMANNLGCQGYGVTYVGALGGEGAVHPVFKEFAENCTEVITLCDPAHTDALEFSDGKIMMGKMDTLPQVSWKNLLKQTSEEDLKARLEKVELIGGVNWTMLPNMNSLLIGLSGILAQRSTRAKVFIDLTDPRKRSAEDIAEVLSILSEMQEGADVILGLNENESVQVSEVLFDHASDDIRDRAQLIRTKLGLYQVVIHPTRSAAVASAEGEWFLEGPYTPNPKLTTGAGDNFNAGYCNGLLSGLNPQQCLVSGVCSSGFYVRSCRSSSRTEMVDFMRQWAAVDGGDLP